MEDQAGRYSLCTVLNDTLTFARLFLFHSLLTLIFIEKREKKILCRTASLEYMLFEGNWL